LKAGWQIVDRGGLNFSADGLKLSVGTVKPAERPTELPKKSEGPGAPTATPDRFELDLWHWKDEAIQPMQKLRSATDRLRTYRAVYFLDTKQFKHVQDDDLTIGVPDFGDWTLAGSDKKYRGQTWQFPIPRDYTLVNIRTAESKPLKTAFVGNFGSSPKGTYYTTFDGKDWLCVRVPDGKVVNLTAKVPGVKFFNEQFDSPSVAPPYGALGWSADEKAFFVYDNCDIWRLAPDGSDATRLTQGGLTGTRFRFSRVEKPFDPKAEPERGLDTTKPWLLSAEDTATHDTGYYRLEPGQKPKLLVMGARKYGPTVKARQADVLLFTVETFQNFPDFFVSNSNFHDIRRITDINPRVAEFNWGKAELLNFQSTEGQAMKAMVVKPENFDPKKKYPMVVYIYERLSENLHNFRIPSVRGGQIINPTYYASNGYIVLMPDIAYRTGQPGQSAIRCVLPAIQAMVDQGCVNEKAIGINGQSWGGYQIAYMVTQTNRFKAAVAGAPVSNMVSAYNGIRWGSGLPRQFQYEKTQSRIGETLWQAPFKYIENSPVFQADRVQTPLMMIHNDQDDAVPWYQGIEYYLALRRLNKEVYLLNYNGQPHNLTNRAAARDFAVRMQQFFDHHLKGAPMPEWMAKGVPYLEREKEKEQIRRLLQSPEKK
jgi:dipeptidyl aminopeptidase/acylaminoacyl peptidase